MKLKDRFYKFFKEVEDIEVDEVEDKYELWASDLADIAEKFFVGVVMNISVRTEEYRQEINELKEEINK